MTARRWRTLTMALSSLTIAAGVTFGVTVFGAPTPAEARPWGIALSVGSLLCWAVNERYRAVQRAEWAAIDQVNDELARARARRQR